jgi:cytidylate kinase
LTSTSSRAEDSGITVWTIAADEGTAGERLAAALAATAGIPLYDRDALVELARRLRPELVIGDVEKLPQRIGGRMVAAALGLASTTLACSEAMRELRFRDELVHLADQVFGEAARGSCVIVTSVGFAALRDTPGAVHVRVRAPLEWRIAAYQRQELVDHQAAEKAVKHADHQRHVLVKAMYRTEIEDDRHFSIVLDASRFSVDRMVDVLLAAGAHQPAAALALGRLSEAAN